MSDYAAGGGFGSFSRGGGSGFSPYDVAEEERIGRRIQLLQRFAPELGEEDPSILLDLATANDDDERMVRNAVNTMGFATLNQRIADLSTEPDDVQRAVFADYPEAIQQALTQAGYQPPEREDRDDGGILTSFGINLPDAIPLVGRIPVVGDAINAGFDQISPDRISVDGPLGVALGAPQHIVGEVLQGGMGAMEAAGRVPSHLYRMAVYDEGGLASFSPSRIAEAWTATGDGEEFLRGDVRRRLDATYGADKVDAAIHLSAYGGNRSLEEMAKDRWDLTDDDPTLGQRVLELYEARQDPDVQAAMAEVEGNRVSLGRDIARGIGLDPTTGPGRWLSGGTDAAVMLFADPTNVAGAWIAKGRYARYAFNGELDDLTRVVGRARRVLTMGGEDAVPATAALTSSGRELLRGASQLRWARHVAENFDRPARLWRDLPQVLPAWDDMTTWQAQAVQGLPGRRPLTDVEGVLDFLDSQSGKASLLSTALGGRHVTRELRTVPHLTRAGQYRVGTSRLFDEGLSRVAATAGRRDVDDLDEVARLVRLRTAARVGFAREAVDRHLADADVDVASWREAEEEIARRIKAGDLTFDDAVSELSEQFMVDPKLSRIAVQIVGPGAPRAQVADTAVELARTTAQRAISAPGRFVFGLTRHAPYANVQLLSNSPDAYAQFDRFANVLETLGLSKARADLWRDAFAGVEVDGDGVRRVVGTNQAVRSAVVESAVADLFDRLEVTGDLRDRFVGRFRHVYASGSNDTVNLRTAVLDRDVQSRGAMLLDSQYSAAMALPSIEELLAVTRRETLTRFVMHNTPVTWANAKYGRLWKPAVLLRLGFILRAGGEELLNFALLHGPHRWLQAKGAEWIAADDAFAATGDVDLIRSSMLAPVRSLANLWGRWTQDVLGRPLEPAVARQIAKHDPDLAQKLTTWQGLDVLTPTQRAKARRSPAISWRNRIALWDPKEALAHDWAVRISGFVHDAVRNTFLPSKADVARALLRPDQSLVDFARLMLDDPLVARALAEKVSAGTFQVADVFGELAARGPRTTTALSIEGGQTVLRDVPLNTRRSDFTVVSRLADDPHFDPTEFADFYVTHLDRIGRDEVLGPVLADVLPRHVDDRTIDELNQISDVPAADFLRAVEADARAERGYRRLLADWADGAFRDLDADQLDELLESYTIGVPTFDAIRPFLAGQVISARTRWLLATKFADDWAPVAGKAELRRLLAARLGNAYANPKHAELLRAGRLPHYGDGMPTFHAPIPDKTFGVYTPALDAIPVDAYERIVARLVGTEYDGDTIAEAFLRNRWTDDVAARWAATTRPASRWVTSDPELAQLLAEALGAQRLVIGHLPTSVLGTGGWEGQRLRQIAGGIELDAPWFARFDAPADTVRKVRLRVDIDVDGETATGWIDEADYTPEMGEIVETRIIGGNPDRDVYEALGARQADEVLQWLTSFDRPGSPDAVFHELLGPLRHREQLPDGNWTGGLDRRHLAAVDVEDLPTEAFGPSRVLASELTWDRFVRHWFDGPVGQAMTAIIRKPLTVHTGARILRQHRATMAHFVDAATDAKVAKILTRLGNPDDVDVAADRAAMAWDEIFARAAGVDYDPDRTRMLKAVEEAFRGTDKWEDGAERLARVLGLDDWDDAERLATGVGADTPAARFAATRKARREGRASDPRWITEDEFHTLRTALAARRSALDLTRSNVLEATIRDVVPYIDDHRVRSIFQEYVGNFVPFWFAEEAFLKRWARSIAERPEVLRRMQLMMHGFRAGGVVRDDGNGNEIFVYPLSGEALAVMTPVIKHLFGAEAAQLVPSRLTGDVRYVLPGFGDQMGAPSFGPLVGLGIELASRRYPELSDLERRLLGDRGADRSLWDFFFPTQITNLVRAYVGEDLDGQIHSATIQAAQTLMATGHGPRPGASPAELEEFTARVRDTARSLLALRAVFAFGAPASPRLDIGEGFAAEFQELLSSGVPFEDAFAAFIEAHPDATPYTVFGTEMDAPARAVTTEAYDWMTENAGLLDAFPAAAPWLLPARADGDAFDRRARAQQLADGLRRRRGIDEFVEEVLFAEAAPDYFDTKDTYDGLIEAAASDGERRSLRDEWGSWSEAYRNLHPSFAAALVDPTRQQRRIQVMDEMRQVVAGYPDLVPDGLADLIEMYDDYQLRRQALTGLRSTQATQRKDELDATFAGAAFDLVTRHPHLRPFFDRVIRPDVDAIEDTDSMSGAA